MIIFHLYFKYSKWATKVLSFTCGWSMENRAIYRYIFQNVFKRNCLQKSLTVKPIRQNMLLAVQFGINYWNSIIVQLVFTMTQLLSTKTKLYSHRILVVNQKLMWHSFWSFSFLFQYGISNKPPNCVISERQSSQYFVM